MKREISYFFPLPFPLRLFASRRSKLLSHRLRSSSFAARIFAPSLPLPSLLPCPSETARETLKPKGCKNRRRGKEGLCFCGVGKYVAYLFGGYFVGVSTCFSSLLLQPPLQLQYKFGYKNLFTLLPCYPRCQFERFYHGASLPNKTPFSSPPAPGKPSPNDETGREGERGRRLNGLPLPPLVAEDGGYRRGGRRSGESAASKQAPS